MIAIKTFLNNMSTEYRRLEINFNLKKSANLIWAIFVDSRRFFNTITEDTHVTGRDRLPTVQTGTLEIIALSVATGTTFSLDDVPEQLLGIDNAKSNENQRGTQAQKTSKSVPNTWTNIYTEVANLRWHPEIQKVAAPVLLEQPRLRLTTLCKSAGLKHVGELPKLENRKICYKWEIFGKCMTDCKNGSHGNAPITDEFARQLLEAIKPGLNATSDQQRKRTRS
ncbi:MAG: hypothetical protein ACREOZ_03990 [Gloeomargaritales cyanobacterium]